MNRPKRLVIVSDLHCGHQMGLTPPKFRERINKDKRDMSKKLWDFIAKEVDAIRPIDILLCNGDALNGKSGGFWGDGTFTKDRFQQVNIAEEALRFFDAKDYLFTYGTPCHVGDEAEDWEEPIAARFKGSIRAQQEFQINKTVFHAKHYIQGSGIPHGRFTGIARERLWGTLWAEYGERKKAHVTIRSHVHSYSLCRGFGWTGFTTPALEAWDTKHGQRNLSGTSDFGFLSMDIKDGPGEFDIREHITHGILKADSVKF